MEELRLQISGLEGRPLSFQKQGLRFDLPDIDDALPGGSLASVALHELVADGDNMAASAGFLCALLSRRPGPLIWIVDRWRPYPPGLVQLGLPMESVVFVEAYKEADRLWVMEEALRISGIAAVIGTSAAADLTSTRRLQLASEKSATPGFLLRTGRLQSSACTTRWRITAAPSQPEDGLPGLGTPRWQVELLKARGGSPGQWVVEWADGQFKNVVPNQAVIPAQAGIHGTTGCNNKHSSGGPMDPGLRRDDERKMSVTAFR